MTFKDWLKGSNKGIFTKANEFEKFFSVVLSVVTQLWLLLLYIFFAFLKEGLLLLTLFFH